jgi:5-methylcytosine-specific restriction endonuclease McrA
MENRMAKQTYTGTKRICKLYKPCKKCKQEKNWLEFEIHYDAQDKRNVCLDCRRIEGKKRYQRHREKNIARQRERMARLEAEGKAKDIKRRYRKAQRARYLAAGLTANGTPRKAQIIKKLTAEQIDVIRQKRHQVECGKWRRNWLKHHAPAPCVSAWYAGTGKPWNNPRLDPSEKFKVRYNCDDTFRAKEIIKAQNRKVARAERIAELSDGSVTPEALGGLFGEAKFCVYCVEPFNDSYDKTADHVDPLYLGGKHSMDNLVICCRSCNSRKGRKGFVEWLIAERPILNLPR